MMIRLSVLQSFFSRRGIVFLHDIVMAALSFLVALVLRLGLDFTWRISWQAAVSAMLIFAVLCSVIFWWQGLYKGVWRYASLGDLAAIARAVTFSVVLFVPVMFFLMRLDALPRSLPIIMWFVLMALLGGPRFVYRVWRDHSLGLVLRSTTRIPVLLVGTREGAEMFIRAMSHSPQAHYQVVGLLTEHEYRVGMMIHGVPVLGLFSDLLKVVEGLRKKDRAPHRIILANDDLDRDTVAELFDEAQTLGIGMARLPRLSELREGVDDDIPVRPVSIEDLLGRPQAALDRKAMRTLIEGRRVLVTGAGGSIGSELVRQIAAFRPQVLALVESSEFALYTIDFELGESFSSVPRLARVADVRDAERLGEVFAETRPELVFHAAALKHVPLVEANPVEGLKTNTLGTRIVAEVCRRHDVDLMVLISTDKAVNPTNIMGATKRMAELYCQALDVLGREQGGTRFITVRFGNVLGSTGSVVPLFQRQLSQGGPLTVTHPEMTRYFMTIREAVELVLEASALGSSDEAVKGRIYVLDMGTPVRIADLARQMIRLAGLQPEKDIRIEFTGMRPGEKLFEEVFHGAEAPVPTRHEGLLLAAPRSVALDQLESAFHRLSLACAQGNREQALAVVQELVPEYCSPDNVAGSRTIFAS